MLHLYAAIASMSKQTRDGDVCHVAAMLQTQVTRDLGPIWGVSATVAVVPALDDVPIGFWPLVIVDHDLPRPGWHHAHYGQPMAFVEYSDSWSLTASHELLEMLCDPWGRRFTPGRSPKPDQGQVEFLVEVSDPCQDASYAYTINGVLVSDFVTPEFYTGASQTRGGRYSFGGHVEAPREVLPGGYVTWLDPETNEIWQEVADPEPRFRSLGSWDFQQRTGRGSLRTWVDEKTPHPGVDGGLPEGHARLQDAQRRWTGARSAARAQGRRLWDDLAPWREAGGDERSVKAAERRYEPLVTRCRASMDELWELYNRLADDEPFRREYERDPRGVLQSQYGIEVSDRAAGTVGLPPAEQVRRFLEELKAEEGGPLPATAVNPLGPVAAMLGAGDGESGVVLGVRSIVLGA